MSNIQYFKKGGITSVHHLVDWTDFESVYQDGSPIDRKANPNVFTGYCKCKHCGEVMETGLVNLSKHWEECLQHPVFVSNGFDWDKLEPVGEYMPYGAYIQKYLK